MVSVMSKRVKVVIIGAGSAGLSAMRQVREKTDDYVIINHGYLGTKCAKRGCMPSKALIEAANDFYKIKKFAGKGIGGTEYLTADISAILSHVRSMRDLFAGRMEEVTKKLTGDHLIEGKARIISSNSIEVNGEIIETVKIIIATGAPAKVPAEWLAHSDKVFTSDSIFEQQNLPKNIALIGLGTIGLELGQSLSRLGVNITGFYTHEFLPLATDPQVSQRIIDYFSSEFPIKTNDRVNLHFDDTDNLYVEFKGEKFPFDAAIVAMGLDYNLKELGLVDLGIELDSRGRVKYDTSTMQIPGYPIYIAGDATGDLPILHEAIDEGTIAGLNAMADGNSSYRRRVPLKITFSDPQIAVVGKTFSELEASGVAFVIGEADIEDEPRARLELNNYGMVRIYAYADSGVIAGAELFCAKAESMAHLLALAIENQLTVRKMQQMPFYHPNMEEAIKECLIALNRQIPGNPDIKGIVKLDS